MNYRWKEGSRPPRISANVAGVELERIRAKHGH